MLDFEGSPELVIGRVLLEHIDHVELTQRLLIADVCSTSVLETVLVTQLSLSFTNHGNLSCSKHPSYLFSSTPSTGLKSRRKWWLSSGCLVTTASAQLTEALPFFCFHLQMRNTKFGYLFGKVRERTGVTCNQNKTLIISLQLVVALSLYQIL